MATSDSIFSLKNIGKSFFGAPALQDISIDIYRGEILGLVGENGAGKSTLMNILGGVLRSDRGTMQLRGQLYEPTSPKAAQKAGIAFIHQELNLVSNLSVAENLFLDDLPLGALWSVKFKSMRETAHDYLRAFDLDIAPSAPVGSLPMGIRQTIEITKALVKKAEIVIFDEPTTSLSQTEKSRLFEIIAQLRANGVTIIYISHILEDVFHLCDRIAVLRDGCLISVNNRAALTPAQVIRDMVGRELNQVYPRVQKSVGESIYQVRDVSRRGQIEHATFNVCAGEIVGLFGLMGSGRTELLRLLFGVEKFETGEIYFADKTYNAITPAICIQEGMAYVTEDRRNEGLLMPKSVHENLVMTLLDRLVTRFGVIDTRHESGSSAAAIRQLDIKVHNHERQPVRSLSGGNQQKVVIGKWLARNPKLLLLDEPTRGVDVGAKHEIYNIINRIAEDGSAILFVSSEMEELMGLCDRILVMCRGKLVACQHKGEYAPEVLMAYALGEIK